MVQIKKASTAARKSGKVKPKTTSQESEANQLAVNKLTQCFDSLTTSNDHFIIPDEGKSEEFKELTKSLYEFGQNAVKASDSLLLHSKERSSFKPLKSLFVKGFDNEQIWQQLNVFNSQFISSSVNEISSLASKRAALTLNIETKSKHPKLTQEEAVKSILKTSNTKESVEKKELKGNGRKVKFSLSEDGDEKSGGGDQARNSHEAIDFFNKDEMEAFLDAEDRKAMDNDDVNKKDDDDDIDYFADIPSDSDDEDGENEERGMYSSFFDEPSGKELKKKKKDDIKIISDDDDDDDDEEGDLEDEELDEGGGVDDEELDTRDFDDEDFDDDDGEDVDGSTHILGAASDSDEEEEEEGEAAASKDDVITRKLRALANEDLNSDRLDADDLQSKSEFERSQLLLKRRIAKAERELLHPSNLHWQLAGETTGEVRPENSLLEEHLQFDHVSKPAPLITDQTTVSLEGLIRQRIKDGAFDDVERKEKPTEQPFEFRRRILLQSEKSKVGLAEVYETEYLKKQQQLKEQQEGGGGALGFAAAGEQEETETRKEVRRMMRTLFRKLDALSAFHYTPRPPEAEVKIINNLPAISVEEVTPDTVSDMRLLAPEEVFSTRAKKVLQAAGERTATDRKRARRLKKKKQSVRQATLEQKQATRTNKAEIDRLKTAKKDSKKGGVAEATNGTFDKKALSSSTKFFERLQESKETGKMVKRKKALAKSDGASLAKKLKL